MDAIKEIERLTELAERLKLEAQIHAQEAATANATIAEIYQLCTGKTGEPGNWNGAEPVRQIIAARDAEMERLKADLEKSERIHADKISLARGAAKFAAWQDFAARFDYSQRKHMSNLMAHEWTICAIEIQSKYGTNNGATPERIEAKVSIAKALENIAALNPTQGANK